jgi:septal ring factor EnvC (AmiA/AmiB activator)
MIGAIADISERKRALEILEQRVATRTAELQAKNQELEQEISQRRSLASRVRLIRAVAEAAGKKLADLRDRALRGQIRQVEISRHPGKQCLLAPGDAQVLVVRGRIGSGRGVDHGDE